MKYALPLPKEKKLTVVVRVEPGCLGPRGIDHIEAFCNFAQIQVAPLDAGFVHWQIIPRHDKSLPEMEYATINKKLTHNKADKYLGMFDKSLDTFEDHIHHKLTELIDQFMGH